jgi:SRSO17 transposase
MLAFAMMAVIRHRANAATYKGRSFLSAPRADPDEPN